MHDICFHIHDGLRHMWSAMWPLSARHAACSPSERQTQKHCTGCVAPAYLVKVCRQPVHDHIESIMKSEVVDDDGPDGRLSQHAQPGGRWGASLLFRFSRCQGNGGQPASMSAAHSLCIVLCSRAFTCVIAFTHTTISCQICNGAINCGGFSTGDGG